MPATIDDQSRNLRDVVAHLHAWQLMTMDWCRIGDEGGTPHVPGLGRTWRDTPAINAKILQQFAATLGAYFVSATSSHYAWGAKTLKAIRRTM